MKTKEILRTVKCSLVAIALGALFAGCSTTYQEYQGPALPDDRVATVHIGLWVDSWFGYSLRVLQVDGVPPSNNPDVISLLSGEHEIQLVGFSNPEGRYQSSAQTGFTARIQVEAGKHYRFVFNQFSGGLAFGEVR
jgi:hypothetical protein